MEDNKRDELIDKAFFRAQYQVLQSFGRTPDTLFHGFTERYETGINALWYRKML